MEQEQLINMLIGMTKSHISQVSKLLTLNETALNRRENEDSWSILECIEHLNLYGDFYIPEIGLRIKNSTKKPSEIAKSGVIGNYFAKSMLPKKKLNKMKTFKSMNPIGSDLNTTTLDKFLLQQHSLLELLENSRHHNLTKIKTAISISSLLKLRLSDTFKVVIYHNQRHLEQANRLVP